MSQKIMKENSKVPVDGVKLHGFFRLTIHDPDGKSVGDTGWVKNQIVNLGFQDYIVGSLGAIAGAKTVSHMALGTGTAPGAAGTSLNGESRIRKTTANTCVASQTLQCVAAWDSSDNTSAITLNNIGLFNTASAGTLLCGNTFATSQWASNQSISATYQVRFS